MCIKCIEYLQKHMYNFVNIGWIILYITILTLLFFTWSRDTTCICFTFGLPKKIPISHVKPSDLREKVNSTCNTVSSAGSTWQEVYTTPCLGKWIIFSSRTSEVMLFIVILVQTTDQLNCSAVGSMSILWTQHMYLSQQPPRDSLDFNHWLQCSCQTIAG